jgi:hypothetical protein
MRAPTSARCRCSSVRHHTNPNIESFVPYAVFLSFQHRPWPAPSKRTFRSIDRSINELTVVFPYTNQSQYTITPNTVNQQRPEEHWRQGPTEAARDQGGPQVRPGHRWCQKAPPVPPGYGRTTGNSSVPKKYRFAHS